MAFEKIEKQNGEYNEQFKLEKEGDEIIGRYIARKTVNKFDKPTDIVTIETADKTVDMFISTKMLINAFNDNIELRDVIKIIYIGIKPTKDGSKTYKDYDIYVDKEANDKDTKSDVPPTDVYEDDIKASEQEAKEKESYQQ